MISKDLEIKILKALAQAWTGNDSGATQEPNTVTFPSTGYLALFTTMPSRVSSGDTAGELTGAVEVPTTVNVGGTDTPTGYQRINLDDTPFGSHYFTSAPIWDAAHSCFVIENNSAIQFPMATATWSTSEAPIVGFGIYTKPNATVSGDTLTMAGTLITEQPVAVAANSAVAFAAGALKISLTDNSSGT